MWKLEIKSGMGWLLIVVLLAVSIGFSSHYHYAAKRAGHLVAPKNLTVQQAPQYHKESVFYFKNGHTEPSMMGGYTRRSYDDKTHMWNDYHYCVAPVTWANWTVSGFAWIFFFFEVYFFFSRKMGVFLAE